jgi:hypothetical protein
LSQDERVLAEGRAAYLRPREWFVGSTYWYLFVTDSRILWTEFLSPGASGHSPSTT